MATYARDPITKNDNRVLWTIFTLLAIAVLAYAAYAAYYHRGYTQTQASNAAVTNPTSTYSPTTTQ